MTLHFPSKICRVKKLRPKTTGKEQPGTDNHFISISGYCQDVKAGRIRLPAIRNVIAEELIWAVKKNQAISKIETMDQVLSESLARRRLYMILLGVFAGAALLLAGVGIYGMVSYSVNQRIREMGIRIAIGAERGDVLWLVLGHGAKVGLLGIVIGIAAALGLTRLMASLLFGVSATDPLTFTAVALLLTVVALAASFLPARRAMRVDPIVALRHE
jgi:putative ABC transport system permease protein